jgi:L-rhamnose mutarotase
MILETADDFSFEKKAAADAAHPKTVEWEELMWKYQKGIPGTQGKWQLMTQIYELAGE